jgi:hypothetical protein
MQKIIVKYSYTGLIVFTILFSHNIEAGEVPDPADDAGRVQILKKTLSSGSERFILIPAELFEQDRIWRVYNPSTALNIISFTEKTPSGPVFTEENDLIKSFYPSYNSRYSLMIHTSFEHPGTEQFRMIPSHEILLPETILRLSVWVHSESYAHRLILLFEDSRQKEIRVNLGSLDFKGWKRIEKNLPAELSTYFYHGRPNGRQSRLKAVIIESGSSEKRGDATILLDSLLILGEKDKRTETEKPEPW